MPPSRSRAASSAVAQDQALNAAPAPALSPSVKEQVRNSASLPLLPGHPLGLLQGYTLQGSLWFHSVEWATAIRSSVAMLLQGFESGYEQGEGERGAWETFEQQWKETGWWLVPAAGCLEGAGWRRDWGKAVVRGFMEHLTVLSSTSPTQQIAAFFALYTFWSTQITVGSFETIYQEVDIPTLDRLLTLPDILPPLLPSLPPPASASLKAELSHCLLHLLTTSAFQIVPQETFHFPPLPSVHVQQARRAGGEAAGKGVLGVEQEVELWAEGRVEELEKAKEAGLTGRGRSRSASGSPVVQRRAMPGQEDEEAWDDDKGWQQEDLSEKRDLYRAVKVSALPPSAFTFDTTMAPPPDDDSEPAPKRPRTSSPSRAPVSAVDTLKLRLLAAAQQKTAEALAKMERDPSASTASALGGEARLLGLVKGENDGEGGGLARYEKLMRGLQEDG